MNAAQSTTDSTTPASVEAARKPRKKALKNLMKRDGVWYFHKLVNGKREFNGRKTPFSLDTRDDVVARAKRDAILKAGSGADIDRILGQKSGPTPATLGEIFAAYAAADQPREKTRNNNMSALKLIVRKARRLDNEQVGKFSITELTAGVVHDFQDEVVAATRLEILASAQAAGADVRDVDNSERMLQAKYSANRQVAQARSIFANEKPFRKLHVPVDPGFLAVDDFRVRRDFSFVPMTQLEMDLFVAESKKIRDSNPDVYLTYLLMQWVGLRNEEVEFCKPKEWLVRSSDRTELDIRPRDYFLPKGTPGRVPVPADVVAEIDHLAKGREWLLSGDTPTARYNVTHRTVNEWMADVYETAIAQKVLPADTEIRTSYDLRKQAGSILYEQTKDIMAVQRFLRHESPVTTVKWYANLIKKLPAIAELKGR